MYDGHPKHVESDFAVNKYLHTVASCLILLIYFVIKLLNMESTALTLLRCLDIVDILLQI